MRSTTWLWLPIVASSAIAACSPGDNGGSGDGSAGSPASTGGNGSGSGGSPGTAGGPIGMAGSGSPLGGSSGDPTKVCGTSKAGDPLLRRLAVREIARSLEDIFPEAKGKWSSSLVPDSISHSGFDNDESLLVVGSQMVEKLADTAKSVASAVTGDALNQALPCAASSPNAACAAEFVNKYGKRLFRRPLTAAETARYTEFFNQASAKTNFATGLAWTLRGMIESPLFVYRSEIGKVVGGARQLTQHEIATELAYTYSGTTPSDDLLAKADRNELSTPEQLQSTATALLTSPAGREVLQSFFRSWLGYSRVSTTTKTNVPEFLGLRDQMIEETRHFVEDVVMTKAGGPKELLTAPYTTPSAELASFYEFSAPASPYAVVPRPVGQGVGILAQGSVLAGFAQPDTSSPTKRGILVMEKMLCVAPPPVPATVPPLAARVPNTTTRQRYEQQHAVGSCSSCHTLFDPIGFGFEHFNEVGQYRAQETPLATPGAAAPQPLPIDATGRATSKDGAFEFDGLEELAQRLTEQPSVFECISGHMTTFAFGTTASCLGETKRDAFMKSTIGFRDYLASFAAEPRFVRRDP